MSMSEWKDKIFKQVLSAGVMKQTAMTEKNCRTLSDQKEHMMGTAARQKNTSVQDTTAHPQWRKRIKVTKFLVHNHILKNVSLSN